MNPRPNNFAAGPSVLAEEVLDKLSSAILEYSPTPGESILEISHRSKAFDNIIKETKTSLIKLLDIPDSHAILFLQGGGTGQFALAPLNLLASLEPDREWVGDYIISGTWSKAAYNEAKQLGLRCNVICNAFEEGFESLTKIDTTRFTSLDQAAYLYYCANETVNGVELFEVPIFSENNSKRRVICDASSNILARPLDFSKLDIIFAGAQKNLGPSGVTLVIVEKSLLQRHPEAIKKYSIPSVFDYSKMFDKDSLLNTPPTFAIFAMQQNLKWVEEQGGLQAMYQKSINSSKLIYQVIDNSNGFYNCPIKIDSIRSKANIVFTLEAELEAKFIEKAKEVGLINLKGHRSVGGIRISLYNGLSSHAVNDLVKFMISFKEKYQL